MTRTFDLSSSIDDTYFPLSALRALSARSEETGVSWIVIGAIARDLVVHIPLGHAPIRATKDVDIGIAVLTRDGFTTFTKGLTQRRNGQHAFSIEGFPIDIVPFGGIEADGHITFPDGHRLNVIGLSEAASSPDQVRLVWKEPHSSMHQDARRRQRSFVTAPNARCCCGTCLSTEHGKFSMPT